jgi:GT2 family glycosyltransferase
MRNVSVVICTHDVARFDRLRQAIDSVAGQAESAHEVILVVDGNPTVLHAATDAFPGLNVLPNTRSKGLSGARNTGLLAASGEIVAFLDDDAIAAPDWLTAISVAFSSPFIMGVGGPILPSWPGERPRWMPREFDWVVGCSYEGQSTSQGKVRNLIGCNMAFRRGALLMAGLFAEELGRVGANAAGAEETELCLRASAMFPAARLVMTEQVSVRHQIDEHRTRFDYFVRRCIAEGRSKALMARRHPSRGGLSTERRHLMSVIPKQIAAHLAEGLAHPGTGGLARAAAGAIGTALVVGSFLLGKLTTRGGRAPQVNFAPIKVVDVDLGQSMPTITARADSDERPAYGTAHLVLRNGGKMSATLQVPLYGNDLTSAELATVVEPHRVAAAPASPVTPPRARVVVATRDRTASLVRCLDSLLAQDHPDFDIVVVDNAPSTDETLRMVERAYLPTGRVRYIREERPGLATAHNRGLEGLDVEVVAFTDDDVVADRSWLSKLTLPIAEDAKVGCVTGGIVPAELETRAQYWTELHGGFLKGAQRQTFDLTTHRAPGSLFPFAAGMFGSGANMAFRRSALADIGGFDPALGAGTRARGGDDLAAFVDTILAGYRLVFNPDALVWHYHRRSEEGMQRQAFGYGVGLGAYLTRLVVRKPALLSDFVRAAPAALKHILGRKSAKNARLPADYPNGFVWRERFGILAGVPAYFQSRSATHGIEGPGTPSRPTSLAWKSN